MKLVKEDIRVLEVNIREKKHKLSDLEYERKVKEEQLKILNK